ncbi:polyamine aminopropyltransferase [Pseudazoarcus pumilus]|uniref:Spermidine synthase n=1 Tax=Pseudazoarcus pumilus TaxID=2067960 RepID=A0A2I6S2N0_9RHOO|nr:spermidine synthase [Pseudazoarcus pumilus]AUN93513.1 spermidine synthase [Pseudazoarcus pumilus]
MNIDFIELDYRETPIGAVSIRRRSEVRLGGVTVYEIKLDDEFLMSSLFTASEEALARLGLAPLERADLDVIVGGLGLGYTAATVLENPAVGSLHVVDWLAPVIEWHETGICPLGPTLTADARCSIKHGDFFRLAVSDDGFLAEPGRRFDAILLDIDHTPQHVLNESHAGFYTRESLTAMTRQLKPDGVFALWSDDPPHAGFEALLGEVFESVAAHVVPFPNPYTGGESACTVYVAQHPR